MPHQSIADERSGRELILDPAIPGQVGWHELLAMGRLAVSLPDGAVIVETGSLFGRSSFVWSKNAPTADITCIDPWVREDWVVERVEGPQHAVMPFSIEAHAHYTETCTNITRVQGYSPDAALDWDRPIDLYFDDSVHEQPGLGRNLDFWVDFVRPGGVVCGDDFGLDCPDVQREAVALAELWSVPVETCGRFWWIHKPANARSAVERRRFVPAETRQSGLFRRLASVFGGRRGSRLPVDIPG